VDKLKRPPSAPSQTWHDSVGHHKVSITIGFIDDKPMEVFMRTNVSHATAICERAWIEALARSVSTGLRHGIPPEVYIEQFQGVTCIPEFTGNAALSHTVKSPTDFLAQVLKIVTNSKYVTPKLSTKDTE